MQEITFRVIPGEESEGGFTALWDDEPGLGGITTEGDSLSELEAMVLDAVALYFEGCERPQIRLHFQVDPSIQASHETPPQAERSEGEASVLPLFARPLKVGTLARILQKAGVTVEEFVDAL